MSVKLKRVADQVIVITGGTSGIGLATAYEAAARGARTVLVARNRAALDQVVGVIRARGGRAIGVVADVAERGELEAVARAAVQEFGGFDTWVNNAGVGIFGKLEEVSEADHRRLFDVNYWGLVNGSLIAVQQLRRTGGALINLGSVVSDVSFPMQGIYCASKAAIRGFTDSLRMELQHDDAPVSVTLIKPSAIATPFAEHARNYMDREPKLPPPLYAPEDVAVAILHAAEWGGRDVYVGGGGKLINLVGKNLPGAIDFGGSRLGPALSKKWGRPERAREGNLYKAGRDGDVRGEATSPVLRAGNLPAGRTPLFAGALLALAGTAAALLGGRR